MKRNGGGLEAAAGGQGAGSGAETPGEVGEEEGTDWPIAGPNEEEVGQDEEGVLGEVFGVPVAVIAQETGGASIGLSAAEGGGGEAIELRREGPPEGIAGITVTGAGRLREGNEEALHLRSDLASGWDQRHDVTNRTEGRPRRCGWRTVHHGRTLLRSRSEPGAVQTWRYGRVPGQALGRWGGSSELGNGMGIWSGLRDERGVGDLGRRRLATTDGGALLRLR